MECSDAFFVWVDKETGMISPVNPVKNIYKSLYSKNRTRFAKVNIPYTSKLLIHELMSNHIVPRIEDLKQKRLYSELIMVKLVVCFVRNTTFTDWGLF